MENDHVFNAIDKGRYLNSLLKKTLIYTLSFIISSTFSSSVFANSQSDIDAAIKQIERIEREQRERAKQDEDQARDRFREEKQKLREIQEEKNKDLEEKSKPEDPNAGNCRDIHTIKIIDSPTMFMKNKNLIIEKYNNKCLNSKDIEKMMAEVSQYYLDRGYITTRAFLQAQDVSKGELTIRVVEGKIQKIIIDDGGTKTVQPTMVFPNLEGNVLNLRDIEQGIDQINRLSSNGSRMDIQPGDDVGKSIIYVKNTPSNPLHLSASTDNSGSASTGKIQSGLTLNADDVLNWQELISITHREAIPNEISNKYSSSDSLNVNVPYGYVNFSYNVNYSEFTSMVPAPSGVGLKSNGNSWSQGLRVERVLYRNQQDRLAVYGNLSIKDNKNYLADQFLAVSSKRAVILDSGMTYSTNFWRGSFSADLSYNKGLSMFGALKDADFVPTWAARNQFSKTSLNLTFSRSFAPFNKTIDWTSSFSTQWGYVPLLGSEQFSIGGQGSVRGFLNNSISGENGYYWRNDLAFRKTFIFGEKSFPVKFYAGIDVGEITSSLVPGTQLGHLMGSVFGASVSYKNMSLDLSQSQAIQAMPYMNYEVPQVWFRLNASF